MFLSFLMCKMGTKFDLTPELRHFRAQHMVNTQKWVLFSTQGLIFHPPNPAEGCKWAHEGYGGLKFCVLNRL